MGDTWLRSLKKFSFFFLFFSPSGYQDYLQKTVVISLCTLELTPPILYNPIVFMPA